MSDHPEQRRQAYRVIGFRHDGTRLFLTENVTLARARTIQDKLLQTSSFHDIRVEVDHEPAVGVNLASR